MRPDEDPVFDPALYAKPPARRRRRTPRLSAEATVWEGDPDIPEPHGMSAMAWSQRVEADGRLAATINRAARQDGVWRPRKNGGVSVPARLEAQRAVVDMLRCDLALGLGLFRDETREAALAGLDWWGRTLPERPERWDCSAALSIGFAYRLGGRERLVFFLMLVQARARARWFGGFAPWHAPSGAAVEGTRPARVRNGAEVVR
jgi:hypothetical protein